MKPKFIRLSIITIFLIFSVTSKLVALEIKCNNGVQNTHEIFGNDRLTFKFDNTINFKLASVSVDKTYEYSISPEESEKLYGRQNSKNRLSKSIDEIIIYSEKTSKKVARFWFSKNENKGVLIFEPSLQFKTHLKNLVIGYFIFDCKVQGIEN